MNDLKQLLKDYVATANYNNLNWDVINSKFPEFKGYDKQLLKDYVATANYNNLNWDVINSKFPEYFPPTEKGFDYKDISNPFKEKPQEQKHIFDYPTKENNFSLTGTTPPSPKTKPIQQKSSFNQLFNEKEQENKQLRLNNKNVAINPIDDANDGKTSNINNAGIVDIDSENAKKKQKRDEHISKLENELNTTDKDLESIGLLPPEALKEIEPINERIQELKNSQTMYAPDGMSYYHELTFDEQKELDNLIQLRKQKIDDFKNLYTKDAKGKERFKQFAGENYDVSQLNKLGRVGRSALNTTATFVTELLKGVKYVYDITPFGQLTGAISDGLGVPDYVDILDKHTDKWIEDYNQNTLHGQSGLPEFVGGTIPYAAMTIADVYSGGTLTPFITSAFTLQGMGEGIKNYDKIVKETGQEPNEAMRALTGVSYATANAGTMLMLGKLIPKASSKAVQNGINEILSKSAPELEQGARALVTEFAKNSNDKIGNYIVGQGKNLAHGTLAMNVMGLQKKATNYAIGDRNEMSLKDWGKDIVMNTTNAFVFGLIHPLVAIKENRATNIRREQQGFVAMTKEDGTGNVVEVVPTKKGNMKLTGNKLEKLSKNETDNVISFTTEHFNQLSEQIKKTGSVNTENLLRDTHSAKLKQNIGIIGKNNEKKDNHTLIFGINNPNDVHILQGRDKDNNVIAMGDDGQTHIIGKTNDKGILDKRQKINNKLLNAEQKNKITDEQVHEYMMNAYDAKNKPTEEAPTEEAPTEEAPTEEELDPTDVNNHIIAEEAVTQNKQNLKTLLNTDGINLDIDKISSLTQQEQDDIYNELFSSDNASDETKKSLQDFINARNEQYKLSNNLDNHFEEQKKNELDKIDQLPHVEVEHQGQKLPLVINIKTQDENESPVTIKSGDIKLIDDGKGGQTLDTNNSKNVIIIDNDGKVKPIPDNQLQDYTTESISDKNMLKNNVVQQIDEQKQSFKDDIINQIVANNQNLEQDGKVQIEENGRNDKEIVPTDAGDKNVESPAYPTLEDGTPDLDKMTTRQLYDYDVNTKGEAKAIKELSDEITTINKLIQKESNRKSNLIGAERRKVDAKIEILQSKKNELLDILNESTEKRLKEFKPVENPVENPKDINKEGSGNIKDKWNSATRIKGKNDAITLANGEVIEGHYELVDANDITPSHDSNNFEQSKDYPTIENGNSVNTTDYKNDKNAKENTTNIAVNFDSRAVPPVVVDGATISGNGTTIARQISARNGTDSKYVEHITKYSDKWGFTKKQIEQTKNATIVFVPKDTIDFTPENFAKFNQTDLKRQSVTEKAVRMSKTLPDTSLRKIGVIVDNYDTLGEFYKDANATKQILHILLNDKIILQNEVGELMNGNLLSETGKELFESVLFGGTLDEQAIRALSEMKGVRQILAKSILQLINNAKLEKFNLKSEISEAIKLLYQVRQEIGQEPTENDINTFILQPTFGKEFGENPLSLYQAVTQLFTKAIIKGQNEFKRIISSYNKQATDVENGQTSMFESDITKEELLRQVLQVFGYNERTFKENDYGRQSTEPVEPRADRGTNSEDEVRDATQGIRTEPAGRTDDERTVVREGEEEPRTKSQEPRAKRKEERQGEEESNSTLPLSEYKPIGKGNFGDIYDQFKGKPVEASKFLMNNGGGEAVGVFSREGLGEIDLPYGSDAENKGLEHIVKKHVMRLKDFDSVEQAMMVIDDVIKNGKMTREKSDKAVIEKDGYKVIVRKNVRDNEGKIIDDNKKWVVTSFDGSRNEKEKSASAVTRATPNDNEGGRAVASEAVSSHKGTTNEFKKQEIEQKIFELEQKKTFLEQDREQLDKTDIAQYAKRVSELNNDIANIDKEIQDTRAKIQEPRAKNQDETTYTGENVTQYEIRRSNGGWSVDKKIGKSWIFDSKFPTKKAAQEYIDGKTNRNTTPDDTQEELIGSDAKLQSTSFPIPTDEAGANKVIEQIHKVVPNAKVVVHSKSELPSETADDAKRQQYSKEINDTFNEQLQQQIDGKLPKGHVYQLGNADGILNAAGLPNLPIELSADRLRDKSDQENHPFTLSEITDLPNAIHNPIAVFDSKTQPNSKVVLTEIKHGDKNFIVAIKTEQGLVSGRKTLVVNEIKSLYPKDTQQIVKWIEQDGLLKWADKGKATDWLGKQQSNSADVAIPKSSISATKIIQDFENPTIKDDFNTKYQIRQRERWDNSGYSERDNGTKASVRAIAAENEGTFSEGNFRKIYGLSKADFNILVDLGLIVQNEWHHTGQSFKQTDFYSWKDSIRTDGDVDYTNENGGWQGEDTQNSLAQKYADNKKEIGKLAKEYEAKNWEHGKEKQKRYVPTFEEFSYQSVKNRVTLTDNEKEVQAKRHEYISTDLAISGTPSFERRQLHEEVDDEYNKLLDNRIKQKIEENRVDLEKQYQKEYGDSIAENAGIEKHNADLEAKNRTTAGKEKALQDIADKMGLVGDEAYSKIKNISRNKQRAIEEQAQKAEKEIHNKNVFERVSIAEKELRQWVEDAIADGKITKRTRIQKLPENFIVTGSEMNGKYGWFENSSRYNLPEYHSGLEFASKELLDEYMNKQGEINSIRNEVKYFRKTDGTIYGWYADGEIHLVKERLNPNSAMHEYTHLWEHILKTESPEVHKALIDNIKENAPELIEEKRQDPNYSHLDDTALAGEVLADLTGKNAQELREQYKGKDITTLAKIKYTINKFWEWVKGKFGANNPTISKWTMEQMRNAKLDDIVKGIGDELEKGKKISDLSSEELGKEPLTPKGESLRLQTDEKQLQTIKDKAIADGTFMKAPNGEATKLNERQWLQVRTPEFKQWFGDWENDPENASKVVDENGEPMVVYHDTNRKFTVFDREYARGSADIEGLYFSDVEDPYHEYGDNRFAVFLNMKNPATYNQAYDGFSSSSTDDAGIKQREKLQNKGYDGFIATSDDTGLENGEMLVFNSTQIKSATGNIGAFDRNNADIRFQILGEKGARALDEYDEATHRIDNLKVAKEMEATIAEKKARIEKLRNSVPIEITGDEYKGKYELNRDSAKTYIKDNLRKEYKNKDTGEEILISRESANKITSHSMGDEAHLKSIIAIPKMIEDAIFISESPNEKGNDKFDSYRYYVVGMKIGGVDYTAKLTVGVKQGSRYYDHALTQIEKGKLLDAISLNSSGFTTKGGAPNLLIPQHKDTKLLSILQIPDVKSIRLATGWEKGVDGKWRYEVEDVKLKNFFDWINSDETLKLSDIIDDNKLFSAYPQLKDVAVKINKGALSDSKGSFDAKTNTIELSTSQLSGLTPDKFEPTMQSTFIHEIQHAIQEIEGFAKGGNQTTGKVEAMKYYSKRLDELDDKVINGGKLTNDELKEYSIINREYNKAKDGDFDYKFYKNLVGEVEARNASSRMEMTPEERRQTLLLDTEDVDRKEQIIIRDGLGHALSLDKSPSDQERPKYTLKGCYQSVKDRILKANHNCRRLHQKRHPVVINLSKIGF